MLDEVARMTELDLTEIDAIATGGARLPGCALAPPRQRDWGLALQKPLIAVPTVGGSCHNLYDTAGACLPDHGRAEKPGVYRNLSLRRPQACDGKSADGDGCGRTFGRAEHPWRRGHLSGGRVPVFKAAIEEKLKVPSSLHLRI